MYKALENLIHQGWASPESLAARPGLKLHTVKVPTRWLERATRAVRLVEREFGRSVRVLSAPGLVEVVFRGGTILSLPCPHLAATAYHAALKEKLAQRLAHKKTQHYTRTWLSRHPEVSGS